MKVKNVCKEIRKLTDLADNRKSGLTPDEAATVIAAADLVRANLGCR